MLVLSARLLSLPIVSIQTGARLGHVASAVIDPRKLQVVAFTCEGPLINADQAILHSEDIREISNLGLIVDSADDIMSTDDLVRLKEVLAFKFQLTDKLVVEENGHKVGKVVSYSVEAETFYIIKLHVRPSLLNAFSTTERIIDRSQIVEITPQKVVVRSAAIKEEKPALESLDKVMPAVENPFRRTAAQSDASSSDQN